MGTVCGLFYDLKAVNVRMKKSSEMEMMVGNQCLYTLPFAGSCGKLVKPHGIWLNNLYGIIARASSGAQRWQTTRGYTKWLQAIKISFCEKLLEYLAKIISKNYKRTQT